MVPIIVPDIPYASEIGEILLKTAAGVFLKEAGVYIFKIARNLKRSRVFVVRQAAARNDVECIVRNLSRYLQPREVPTVDRMEEFRCMSKDIFWMVEEWNEERRRVEKVSGVAIIYPLKSKRSKGIATGKETADNIVPSDIYMGNGVASGYYVAFAWGDSKVSQGYMCRVFVEMFSKKATARSCYVFARPTTKEALRFLSKTGFVGCKGENATPELGVICKVSAPLTRKVQTEVFQSPH